MCLYPRKIQNKKYTATAKNNGIIPEMPIIGYKEIKRQDIFIDDHDFMLPDGSMHIATGEITTIKGGTVPIYDQRISYVEVPCGQCIECREKKAREWQVRLGEEIKSWKYKYFITLTFSPEGLREIKFKHGVDECNAAVGFAVRHSLERFRKDFHHSLKHWYITELGHEGTERIHAHGLIMSNDPLEFEVIEKKKDGAMCKWKYWKYGNIFVGNYVSQKSINYLVKYMSKIDNNHKSFIGQILASPGIGKNWIERHKDDLTYTYRPGKTRSDYVLSNGTRVALPKYYKNKLHGEQEREQIWRDFLDKECSTIMGIEINKKRISIMTEKKILAKAKENNHFYGYGNASKEWKKRKHNLTQRMLKDGLKREEMVKKQRLEGQYADFWKNYYEKFGDIK